MPAAQPFVIFDVFGIVGLLESQPVWLYGHKKAARCVHDFCLFSVTKSLLLLSKAGVDGASKYLVSLLASACGGRI